MSAVRVGSVPVMAIGDQDQVRAAALMHYTGATGAATAIMLVQFRPHAIAPAAHAGSFAAAVLEQLRTAGWADPSPSFAGDPVSLPAAALVEGATGNGPVTVTALGEVMYEGPLHRPPGWAALVQAAGAVLVLAGADRSLDDAAIAEDLTTLAAAGKVVAAYGRPPNPLFRR